MKRLRSNLTRRRIQAMKHVTLGVVLGAGLALSGGVLAVVAVGLPVSQAEPSDVVFGGSVADGGLVSLEAREYCRRAALAALADEYHEIEDGEVRFIRDPQRPGNAAQQFSDVFGGMMLEAYRSAERTGGP